ncbi:hypothetical protein ACH4YO_40565 [Streptomyces noursei]|uniref:hypothetical protein n=1 Tax=Streptomyces noursei TaxID=1971 RepID=UPI00081C92C8|nr:hypothetical protein SNOUR_00170 [Streptomyces noursei ATCC 11455]ANZ21978.1 hypothetical protein SNOUR_43780 [Streptomyces noursei ATCC 11455]MCZ0996440.1 hypothetical protein [Streptomyces noursei]
MARKRPKINQSIVEMLEEAEKTLLDVLMKHDPTVTEAPVNTTEITKDLRRLKYYALGKLELALEEIKGEESN